MLLRSCGSCLHPPSVPVDQASGARYGTRLASRLGQRAQFLSSRWRSRPGSIRADAEDSEVDAAAQLAELGMDELLAIVESSEAEQEQRSYSAQPPDDEYDLEVEPVDYDFLFGGDGQSGGGVPVRELVGWKVVLVKRPSAMPQARAALMAGEAVSTAHSTAVITEVIEMSETALHLVRVSLESGGDQGRGEPEGVLIPLVDSIFCIAGVGVLVGAPPAGTLQLGTIGKAWELLERELLPVARRLAGRDGDSGDDDDEKEEVAMPSASQLKMAGRRDLQAACRRVGGTLVVAEALGLQASRKPSGYWDDPENLRKAIAEFCIKSLGLSEGGAWMPRHAQVKNAGRWDLHHAIIASGGYEDVAEMLGLSPLSSERYKRRSLTSPHRQNKTLFVAARKRFEEDWEGSCRKGKPGKRELASDVVKSIKMTFYLEKQLVARGKSPMLTLKLPSVDDLCKKGLFYEAAAVDLLGAVNLLEYADSFISMRPAHRPRGHWSSIEDVAREVKEFVDSHELGHRMPTQKTLKSLGRGDLLYGIKKHGARQIAVLTGLELDSRGGHKRSVHKPLEADKGE